MERFSFNGQTIAMEAAGIPVGRGTGVLNGGAPYYDTYQTSDGRFMAVGAVEEKFFKLFWTILGINETVDPTDSSDWNRQKNLVRQRFLEKPRDEWERLFAGEDACVVPVLRYSWKHVTPTMLLGVHSSR